LWLEQDFDTARSESFDGGFDIVVHKDKDGLGGRSLIPASEEMQCRFRATEPEFDPSPAVLAHGLIGGYLAVEGICVKCLGSILVEHRKLGKLNVHG
jgi:hypothetical protein